MLAKIAFCALILITAQRWTAEALECYVCTDCAETVMLHGLDVQECVMPDALTQLPISSSPSSVISTQPDADAGNAVNTGVAGTVPSVEPSSTIGIVTAASANNTQSSTIASTLPSVSIPTSVAAQSQMPNNESSDEDDYSEYSAESAGAPMRQAAGVPPTIANQRLNIDILPNRNQSLANLNGTANLNPALSFSVTANSNSTAAQATASSMPAGGDSNEYSNSDKGDGDDFRRKRSIGHIYRAARQNAPTAVCFTASLRRNNKTIINRGCAIMANEINAAICQGVSDGWEVDRCFPCTSDRCNKPYTLVDSLVSGNAAGRVPEPHTWAYLPLLPLVAMMRHLF